MEEMKPGSWGVLVEDEQCAGCGVEGRTPVLADVTADDGAPVE